MITTVARQLAPLDAQHFADQYLDQTQKAASAILRMAAAVASADELSPAEQKRFYKLIRLEQNGAKAKKLRVIAKADKRLEPHLDRLPDQWTTIYDLARMKTEEFAQVAPRLTSSMSAKDIRNLLPSPDKPRKTSKLLVQINIGDAPLLRRVEFCKQLQELLRRYEVALPKEQKRLLQDLQQEAEKEDA